MSNSNQKLENTLFSVKDIQNLAVNAANSDYVYNHLNKSNLKKKLKNSLNIFLVQMIDIRKTSGYIKEIITNTFSKQYRLSANNFFNNC